MRLSLWIILILKYVYPFLGNDRGKQLAAVARQRPAKNRGMVFSEWSVRQQLNYNNERCFLLGPSPDVINATRWERQSVIRVGGLCETDPSLGVGWLVGE